jgi:hypothetical protein
MGMGNLLWGFIATVAHGNALTSRNIGKMKSPKL